MDCGIARRRRVTACVAGTWLSVCLVVGCGPAEDALDGGLDASAESSGEPILDAGGGIPEAPNGATLCPVGACNYQTQGGCAQDAAAPVACHPYPNAGGVAPTCAPAGILGEGEACSSWLDCSPGLLCVGSSCRRLCCGGDYTACPDGQHCFSAVLVLVGDAAIASGAMVCLAVGGCDVFSGQPCPQGRSCHIVDPTGAVACVPSGHGQSGDPCPCAAGFACIAERCRRLCRAVEGGGDPFCAASEGRCVHYDRDPPGVGECDPSWP